MASKKELIEAQSFSRRRLVTAFTSGAVGNKEMEPARPMGPVVAGLALAVLVIVVGVVVGFLHKGSPSGWENNHLVIAQDTGARYVSVDGTLYPVLNTASARLLVPAGQLQVFTTTSGQLKDAPLGHTVGIVGAPDQLPDPHTLINTGWTACLDDSGAPGVTVSTKPPATVAPDAAVVARSSTGEVWVVTGTRRYRVDPTGPDAVLRALDLAGVSVRDVDDRWLNLFLPGTDLAPLSVPGAGQPLPGTTLTVGWVVRQTGTAALYLVEQDGTLAPMSPLAYQLYMLGTGLQLGEARDVPAADLQTLHNAPAAGPADWPSATPEPLTGERPCALLTVTGGTPTTAFATTTAPARTTTTTVDTGAGALVRAGGRGTASARTVYLLDATGTAFPVDTADDALTRLGYTSGDLGTVDQAWIDLLDVGVRLSVADAGRPDATPTASP